MIIYKCNKYPKNTTPTPQSSALFAHLTERINIHMVYFITVLIITTLSVPLGWVQFSQSFTDKAICEKFMKENPREILLDISKWMGTDANGRKIFQGAKKFECMSYEEAVKRNVELGH